MRILIVSTAVMMLLAAPAAWAQNAPGDQENMSGDSDMMRGEDFDLSEAPYTNDEQAQPADDDVDEMANAPEPNEHNISGEGASSGQSGLGEDEDDDASPGAPVPEE